MGTGALWKPKWLFEQDSASSHRETMNQEWCKQNFADFITSEEWPYTRLI